MKNLHDDYVGLNSIILFIYLKCIVFIHQYGT